VGIREGAALGPTSPGIGSGIERVFKRVYVEWFVRKTLNHNGKPFWGLLLGTK